MAVDFANKTILVVEDEPGLREPLAENFESLGCQVLQAKNGAEALATVKTRRVDVLISDIRMPGGDGLELLRALQREEPRPPAAMLMTGYAEYRAEDAYQLGAEDILNKPFDLERLESAVNRLLSPVSERWQTPKLDALPPTRFSRRYQSLATAIAEGDLGLGRGGVFLRTEERLPARGKPMAFDLDFADRPATTLRGYGVVRWSRSAVDGRGAGCYGIEFIALESAARERVLALCAEHQTKAYIPSAAGYGPIAAPSS